MNFLDMGIGEILLILIVALIIWGPGKIPEIGRMLGKTMSTLRKSSFDLTTQIRRELQEEEKISKSESKISPDDKDTEASNPETDTAESDDTEGASPREQ